MSTSLSELSNTLASDPDAQATVSDFLDYTEFFPSDVARSLTLIGKLDASYHEDVANLHELTKSYGTLPALPDTARPQPQSLRKDISITLDHAIRCRESTFAEATRLHNLAENLYSRIGTIKKKLQAIPKPPSRESTPVPTAWSPTANRTRKVDNERTPRASAFVDGHRQASAGRVNGHGKPSHRSRRIIIPGEVLPPYDPNSPEPSVDSDSESERVLSPGPGLARVQEKSLGEKVIKIPKATTIRILKQPARARPPGVLGTNVHSMVAGISVSNAMAILEPPPPDPQPGSKHAPWLKLTEWELNKLRKRMKKNADWVPSETMVRRELAENKRGMDNYLRAKAEAEATGGDLLNEEPVAFIRPVTYRGLTTDAVVDPRAVESLENRGMKLNQAKKLKRHTILQEMAHRHHQGSESTERSTTETSFDSISIKPEHANLANPFDEETPVEPTVESAQVNKKRRRESSANPIIPLIDPALLVAGEAASRPQPKKIKLAPPATAAVNDVTYGTAVTSTVTDPVMITMTANGPEKEVQTRAMKSSQPGLGTSENPPILPPPKVAPLTDLKLLKPTTRSNRSFAPSTKAQTPALEAPAIFEDTLMSRPRSRGNAILSLTFGNKKAASAEPPARRASGRRTSNASLPSTQANTPIKPKVLAPTFPRRDKRPAPGVLTSHDNNEGGLQVILGKRKIAPGQRKKSISLITNTKKNQQRIGGGGSTAPATPAAALEEEEPIDPNEARYCICRGVSWGQMVACENPDCENEWFHFECVGLTEMPGRRTKWYCPDCREKLGVGEHGEPKNRTSASRK